MKTKPWMFVVPLVAGALLWSSAHGLAQGRTQDGKNASHKKAHPVVVERASPDRMTRHERQLVQARLAALHARGKKIDMRAFNKDLDRIDKRFDTGDDEQSFAGDTMRRRLSDDATVPSGTRLRAPRSGQVFIAE